MSAAAQTLKAGDPEPTRATGPLPVESIASLNNTLPPPVAESASVFVKPSPVLPRAPSRIGKEAAPQPRLPGKHMVHWFRKGLRLHDNPALREGLQGASTFRCVFIIDPWFASSANVCINKWRSVFNLKNIIKTKNSISSHTT